MGYLTGPVNNLQDFQVEYNGFLMGNGTPYELPEGSDFLDLAAMKTMDDARVWADGSYSGPDFADVLLPSMPLEIVGSTQAAFSAAVQAFISAFGPQVAAVPLWVKLPGMAPQGISAKTNKRALPIKLEWQGLFTSAAVQWRCTDPVWQSVPRTLALAASVAAVSGMNFPLFNPVTAPYVSPGVLDYGATASASSSGVLTNSGNTPAWPVVVVAGPCPNFSIILDGNIVTYSQAVPAGQTVTVDYKSGTATLTGNIDRTASLTARQFSAVSSMSSVFFSALSGTATITVADMSR